MLRYFPMLYPDESMYHLFVRYTKSIGNDSYLNTFKELLGSYKYSGVNSYFVGDLDYLSSNLPNQTVYTPKFFIEKHTIFPIYKPFIPLNRLEKAVQNMRNGSLGAVNNILGITAGSICKVNGLKFCPKCIESDRKKYGEAYLHRVHQVQGVFVCSKHKQLLEIFQPEQRAQRFLYDIDKVNEKKNKIKCEISEVLLDKLFILSADLEYLINNGVLFPNYDITRKKYNAKMHEVGYISPEGLINQVKLHEDFRQFYSSELLRMLESNIKSTDENSWLRTIVRKKSRIVHPIRNLLFIRFLFGSLEKFLSYNKTDYLPFGRPPFQCLNHISNHYNEKVISSCIVNTDHHSSGAIGVFKCEKCGFTYELHSSDFIKTGFKDIKVKTEREGNRNNGLEEQYKDAFLNIIEKNSNLSRRQISGLNPKAYRWLFRYERKWLEERLPKTLRHRDFYKNERVDWNKRDEEFLGLVESTIKNMLNESKPKRVTITSIAKEINYRALNRDLGRLPKTKEIICWNEESVSQFHKRKIDSVIRKLYLEEKKLVRHSILRQANIPDKFQHDYDEYIKKEIIKTINAIKELP